MTVAVAILAFIAGVAFTVLVGVYVVGLPAEVEAEAEGESDEVRQLREVCEGLKQDVVFYRDLYIIASKGARQ